MKQRKLPEITLVLRSFIVYLCKNLKMAVLHKKEEKIQAVIGRLPKTYTEDEFVAQFIKLYGRDWGKIKAAYIKQNQDREPDAVIHMPKPELYLKQLLSVFLQKTSTNKTVEVKPEKSEEITKKEEIAAAPKKSKTIKKK